MSRLYLLSDGLQSALRRNTSTCKRYKATQLRNQELQVWTDSKRLKLTFYEYTKQHQMVIFNESILMIGVI